MTNNCIKQIDGKACGRETVPDSNYCTEHDPSTKHRAGGGGGRRFLDSDLQELGKVYHHDPKMDKPDLS
jgi:hypothetical protein